MNTFFYLVDKPIPTEWKHAMRCHHLTDILPLIWAHNVICSDRYKISEGHWFLSPLRIYNFHFRKVLVIFSKTFLINKHYGTSSFCYVGRNTTHLYSGQNKQ